MALGKTVSYTPFNETSFAYGSNEIATAHATEFPNATDIVKVTISWLSGNWDNTTGHLSTPSVGTAVSVYNKVKKEWYVKGERDDVDAVLAAMSFFPADKAETRLWDPTEESHALKSNLTSGDYGPTEEPPAIGDTNFTVRVYDGSTQVSTQTLTFNVTEAVFGNQRPYFSVAPTVEDLNTTEHDSSVGGLLNLGTISHGSDTENVQVTCEFRHYNLNIYQGNDYGYITADSNIFIGDKKPATFDKANARFDFTGSVAEAQAFLDNIRYSNNGNKRTFDMFLTITDGVVGSTLTKTCYFSDAIPVISDIPDQHYIEDANPAIWDFGNLDIAYDDMPEVNTFTATITLDAEGRANTTSFDTSITVDTDSYNSGTGVLTLSDSSLDVLRSALRNLRFTPVVDYSTSFNMTVDFTFSDTVTGTSHSSVQQSVEIRGEDAEEVSNLTTTHTWTEDQWYDFPNSKTPQIIHGRNDNFDVIFTLSDANAGVLGRHGTNAAWLSSYGTSAQYKLQGTRDEVNAALENLYFTPTVDYDDNFTISFTVDRTSGDLTLSTQSTGSFTMNAIAVSEISFPLVHPVINWENNVSTKFDTGLRVTDTASTLEGSAVFGSTYTVNARLRAFGQQFPYAVVRIDDEAKELLETVTGDRSNDITFTGSAGAVNAALDNFILIPDPDFEELHEFFLLYEITRDADGVKIHSPSASVRTLFNNPTITQPVSVTTPLFNWTKNRTFDFDSGLRIDENITENDEYITANGYLDYKDSNYQVSVYATIYDSFGEVNLTDLNFETTALDSITVSGLGTRDSHYIITGKKADVNIALANMRLRPTTPDYIGNNFRIKAIVYRPIGNVTLFNSNPDVAYFNPATSAAFEYLPTWSNTQYTEDIAGQYIFSHLTDMITDGAGDLFDATYDVTIGLDNETTGKFVPYVNDDYLVDDDINIFVDDYEVRLVGTKAEINEAIRQIQFTPLPDVNANVDIRYTQKRTFNNTTVTHADNVVVTTMLGIATPEFVLGTANNNIQYFVQEEFVNGVDATKTDSEIMQNNADVLLTPKQLSVNMGKDYDAPITITDAVANAQYRIQFTTDAMIPIRQSLSLLDTNWLSKDAINNLIKDGIYAINIDPYPATDPNSLNPRNRRSQDLPRHNDQTTVDFTVLRKLQDGTESQIGQGSLTYEFLSGLTLWKSSTETSTHGGLQAQSFQNGWIVKFGNQPNHLTLQRIDDLPLIQTDPYDATEQIEISAGTPTGQQKDVLIIGDFTDMSNGYYTTVVSTNKRNLNIRSYNYDDRDNPESQYRSRPLWDGPNFRFPYWELKISSLYKMQQQEYNTDEITHVYNTNNYGQILQMQLTTLALGTLARNNQEFGLQIWTDYGVKLFVGSSLSPLYMRAY